MGQFWIQEQDFFHLTTCVFKVLKNVFTLRSPCFYWLCNLLHTMSRLLTIRSYKPQLLEEIREHRCHTKAIFAIWEWWSTKSFMNTLKYSLWNEMYIIKLQNQNSFNEERKREKCKDLGNWFSLPIVPNGNWSLSINSMPSAWSSALFCSLHNNLQCTIFSILQIGKLRFIEVK